MPSNVASPEHQMERRQVETYHYMHTEMVCEETPHFPFNLEYPNQTPTLRSIERF